MSHVETEPRPNVRRSGRSVRRDPAEAPQFTRLPRPVSDRALASLDITAVVVGLVIALGPLTVYAVFGSG
jgi:hypothetical protein